MMLPDLQFAKASAANLRLRAVRRRRQAGFTLIEMVVSLTAGLIIATSAFMLARNSSTLFQHEAMITNAQYGVVIGMSRLQSDLRRAAFMASANVLDDPRLCGNTAGWPAGMLQLSGIQIVQGGSLANPGHALSVANGLTPDALIIGGMVDTTEQFSVATLMPGQNGGTAILLQNDGAMVRTLQSFTDVGTAPLQGLQRIFGQGRFLRIVDQEGRQGYGVITGVQAGPNNQWQVTVANAPALPTRQAAGTCGCEGFCTGALVNPVARVRYDLRAIDPAVFPQYAGLFSKATHTQGAAHRGAAEPPRTELVRFELNQADQMIANTLEVVAEYAVDLKFGITWDNTNQINTTLSRTLIGQPNVYAIAGAIDNNGTPEQIRAVQVRFSTRSPRRDREAQLQLNPVPPPETGLFRYALGANLGFARIRTLIGDVQLPNQARRLQ